MNNKDLLDIINNNEKVLIVLGLEIKNNSLIKDFVENEIGVDLQIFKNKLNIENRSVFYPILEKELENKIKFIYLNVNEIENIDFLNNIKDELFCMPTNIFVKNGIIQPIKYGFDQNYKRFKDFLENFC